MAEYIKREAEYIERDMLCRVLERYKKAPKNRYQRGVEDGMELALNAVKAIHTADVAPVVHRRWGTGRFNLETGNYEEQCTRCRNFSKEYGKPYCPTCGAKMDEKEAVYD